MKTNLVLCYHRISQVDSGGQSLLSVKASEFKWQLRYLKKFLTVTSLQVCLSPHSEKSVAITFDDGYADNLHIALPILEEEQVPAAFFISTGYLDTGLFFLPDLLDEAFKDDRSKFYFEALFQRYDLYSPLTDLNYWKVHDLVCELPEVKFAAILSELSKEFGEAVLRSDPFRRPLTVEELKILANGSCVQIGGHTVNHRRLAALESIDFEKEVIVCMEKLASIGVATTNHFAIPFGQRRDFTQEQLDWLTGRGFVSLSTTPLGIVRATPAEAVPRLCVQDWGKAKFITIVFLVRLAASCPRTWRLLLQLRRNLLNWRP